MRQFRVLLAAGVIGLLLCGAARPVIAANAAPAARTIGTATSPPWVRARSIPAVSAARLAQAQEGVAYLLSDEQVLTRPDGGDTWFRVAIRVTNRSGLESAGQINVSYDPSFEHVDLNFVHILRDGKVIDLTGATHFRVVEHETELDDGIVNGTLKAIANLPDVRVGDVIDFATTRHTRNLLWPGQAFYRFSQRYSEPLGMRAMRYIWPAGMKPAVKAINSNVAFTMRKQDGGSEWEWIATDPPTITAERDVPAGAFEWGRVDISTMHDWGEVARWAGHLYDGDDSLPAPFARRLDAIARAYPKAGDRLTEAARYVQDNIRYVGEELGEGSYVPRRPRTVLARGYGDCKDKSLLLAVALRRLGIDAVPALVTTDAGERLPDRLPSPLDFNHVIVRAVIDGTVMWIDPTGTQRGGRGTAIVPSDLGYALPIRAGQTALEKIAGFDSHAGRVDVTERFIVDEKADVPLTLHVETRATGARADATRADWAASSPDKIATGNLDFYRQRFPGMVASKPLELHDDRDANTTLMVEDYTLSRAAFDKAGILAKLVTRAYLVQGVLPDRQPDPRVQPLLVHNDIVDQQTIELNVRGRTLDGLDPMDLKAGSISFSRQTIQQSGGLRIVYRLDTGTRYSVPAKEAEAVYVLSDKIKDESGIEFYLDRAPKLSVPDGIDAAAWERVRPDMTTIGTLMQKSDEASRSQALALLTSVTDKVPHPSPIAGLIDGMKGALLGDMQRPQAALAALRSSAAQYDRNADILRLWTLYELAYGTPDTLANAFARVSKVQPAVLAAFDKQQIVAAFQKVHTLPTDQRAIVRGRICIALTDAGWQQQPRTASGDDILGCAITAHSLRGETAAAEALLTKDPPTGEWVELALDRRHQALWPAVDRLAVDGFRTSLQKDVERAAAAAKAAPDDYDRVTRLMRALRSLGRYDEALAVGAPLAKDDHKIEIAGTDGFWLVNEYAATLAAVGRYDDALAALDKVLALGIERYPELISLKINRNELALNSGHTQAALDEAIDLDAHHGDTMSSYGRMWVWANEECALVELGRNDQAKAMDIKLLAKPADNWSAVTAAAACRDDRAAIGALLVRRLRDPDARADALSLFIDFTGHGTLTPLPARMRGAMAAARALPAVQAEFRKYGRPVRVAGTSAGWQEF